MKYLLLIVSVLFGKINANEFRSCITPKNETGTCIPFNQCIKYFKLVTETVLTISDREDLEDRECSTEVELNHICCDVIFDNSQCGFIPGGVRISNALNATLFQYPWMVVLEFEDKFGEISPRCGGSLITKNYVLTAGHCLGYTDLKLVNARLGEQRLSTDPDCKQSEDEDGDPICAPAAQVIKIEESILHPEFSREPGAPNDIALLRLSKPAVLGSSVNIICLPIKEKLDEEDYNRKIIVMGFGITDMGSDRASDILQYATINKSDCTESYNLYDKEKQFCAGGTHLIGTCSGDSGGPLSLFNPKNITQQIQIGIVSAGPQCAMFDAPGIYVKVENYIDWILENVEE